MSAPTNAEILGQAIEAIEKLRSNGCHVHSITNTVAQNFTANVLLACGATVSMTANRDELSGFLEKARCVHINLGTIDRERIPAIRLASNIAEERNLPVILDPVMIDRSGLRNKFANFIARNSALIKGNRSEIRTIETSINDQACIIETGKVDNIRYQGQEIKVANGTPLLDKTIATGCALGALMAALVPNASSPQAAGLAGVLWFCIAGEIAAETATGPGSFNPAFLDALYSIPTDVLEERARLS